MCIGIATKVIESGYTISIAESITGGMVAHKFTCVSGASKSFKGGVVAYTNEAKMNLLNVPKEVIDEHTVVSEEVAKHMAIGCLNTFGTDIGVATTGYAEPYSEDGQYAYICVAYRTEYGIGCNVERVQLRYPKSRHRFIEYVTGDVYYLIMKVILTELGSEIHEECTKRVKIYHHNDDDDFGDNADRV